jgi:hypothetical protein
MVDRQFKISAVGRLRGLVIAGLAIAAIGACGPFCMSGKVAVSNAKVDSSFQCPNPSTDHPYDVHGSIDVDNGTGNNLTIKSMSETNVTVAIHGSWSGPLNAKGGGDVANISPKSVKSGDQATIKFTIPFKCTNSGPTVSTYGEFEFKFAVVTSAGTFNLNGANKHRLVIA